MKTCPKCKAPCNNEQIYCVCGYNFDTGLSAKDVENLTTGYEFPDLIAAIFNKKKNKDV